MFPLVDIEERSAENLTELRDILSGQDRPAYEMSSRRISLDPSGIFNAGGLEGPMTKLALMGLLKTLNINSDFGLIQCPNDLLPAVIKRFTDQYNAPIRIHTTDGVITGIMPADRQPIMHDMLIDQLGTERPIKNATLGPGQLRITAITTESKEILPKDTFSSGWELITSETGWQATEVSRWLLREICTNGAIGFDKVPVFKRTYNETKPALVAQQTLIHAIETIRPPELESAVRWASNASVNRDRESVVNYLGQRLEGASTKMALSNIDTSTSWYELLNTITALAQLHRLEMRRRYEAEGGVLLNWFSKQGRGKPPWRRVSCEDCQAFNVN